MSAKPAFDDLSLGEDLNKLNLAAWLARLAPAQLQCTAPMSLSYCHVAIPVADCRSIDKYIRVISSQPSHESSAPSFFVVVGVFLSAILAFPRRPSFPCLPSAVSSATMTLPPNQPSLPSLPSFGVQYIRRTHSCSSFCSSSFSTLLLSLIALPPTRLSRCTAIANSPQDRVAVNRRPNALSTSQDGHALHRDKNLCATRGHQPSPAFLATTTMVQANSQHGANVGLLTWCRHMSTITLLRASDQHIHCHPTN